MIRFPPSDYRCLALRGAYAIITIRDGGSGSPAHMAASAPPATPYAWCAVQSRDLPLVPPGHPLPSGQALDASPATRVGPLLPVYPLWEQSKNGAGTAWRRSA